MIYHFEYMLDGTAWHTGEVDSNHTDPQPVADALLGLQLPDITDEVRVWAGEDTPSGTPDAVASWGADYEDRNADHLAALRKLAPR